ncbi:MAG: cytochrome-c peroxidase [Planctomycetota bacterium]|nr:cytochrome-c peroxidase [Planctomycetota bacterium]
MRFVLLSTIFMGAWASSARLEDLPPDTIVTEALWEVPSGLPAEVPAPEGNPFVRERVELGRRLFFDPILSRDRDRSCATCHQPEFGFATNEARPPSLKGGKLERNAPSLFNRAFGKTQMWDGRFASLEEQALKPIAHEEEMGLPIEEAITRLKEDTEYPALFEEAFGQGPDDETLAKGLASFVRRLFYGNTAMDDFRSGKVFALTTQERAGMWIFQSKANCWRCHHGFNFTDEAFHNTGVGVVDGTSESGRMKYSNDVADRGAFKTPSLRALLMTPPYFHDGSVNTLREVVEFYNRGGEANENLDPQMKPLELNEKEIDLLVAFLGSLSRHGRSAEVHSGESEGSGGSGDSGGED